MHLEVELVRAKLVNGGAGDALHLQRFETQRTNKIGAYLLEDRLPLPTTMPLLPLLKNDKTIGVQS